MKTLEFITKLKFYKMLCHQVVTKDSAAQSLLKLEIIPLLDGLLAKLALPLPSDSPFWLNVVSKCKAYVGLRLEAAEIATEAFEFRLREIDPHLNSVKTGLGLSLPPEPLPDFWQRMEREHGFQAVAITLHFLSRTGIPRAEFEDVGEHLSTTDTDKIFLWFLIQRGDFGHN